MKSYTVLRGLFGSFTGDTATATLTLGDQLINDWHRKLIKKFRLDEITDSTKSTVASTQFYNLPFNCQKLFSVYITIGTAKYYPVEAQDRASWDKLNQTTSDTGDGPTVFYIENKRIGFYPIPLTAGYVITFVFKKRIKDLSIADYTTGSIVTATNGSASIVGTGTTFTAAMAGRWLRITDSDTANKGDGEWYEILSVESATALTLRNTYQGISISTGTATFAIGQMPDLPEDYHDLPVYKATQIYFESIHPETERASFYKNLFDEGYNAFVSEYATKTETPKVGLRMRKENYNNKVLNNYIRWP